MFMNLWINNHDLLVLFLGEISKFRATLDSFFTAPWRYTVLFQTTGVSETRQLPLKLDGISS